MNDQKIMILTLGRGLSKLIKKGLTRVVIYTNEEMVGIPDRSAPVKTNTAFQIPLNLMSQVRVF